jgi:hypothetical protein
MQVECDRCGHAEDETFELDMPFAKSQPIEAYEPGKCPKCGGPDPDAPEADAAAAIGNRRTALPAAVSSATDS